MPYGAPSFMSFADVISSASTQIRDLGMHEFPPSVMAAYAADVCRDFARRTETVRGTASDVLVAGATLHALPEDCLHVNKVAFNYPGFTAVRNLPWREPESVQIGIMTIQSGIPYLYYLTQDRKNIGLYPPPPLGGFDGRTSSSGSSTVINRTSVASTVNMYAGLTVRIMDGLCEGETGTISSNTLNDITVSSAFSNTIQAGVRFQVYPDSLIIEYVRAGNEYSVKPTLASVKTIAGGGYAEPLPGVFSVEGLPDRPRNFWVGCEVRFTSGANDGFKSRVTASRSKGSSAGQTQLTVYPELPAAPTGGVSGLTNGDQLTITDVPNIPDGFHQYLADGIIAKCLMRFKTNVANQYTARYENGIKEAIAWNQPAEGDTYYQIRKRAYPQWSRR